MRVWRICRSDFAADPVGGRGGLYVSGRWHSRGRLIVYTSESLALSSLELLAHLEREVLPPDLVQLEIEIPGTLDIRRIVADELPGDWRTYPAPDVLQQIGDEWLEEKQTAVLEVPSALIPTERNFLINPLHPESKGVAIIGTARFAYDPRLLRGTTP